MSPPQDDQISPISYLMQNHNKVFFFFFCGGGGEGFGYLNIHIQSKLTKIIPIRKVKCLFYGFGMIIH